MPWSIGRPMPLTSPREARRQRYKRTSVGSYFYSPTQPVFEIFLPQGRTAAQAIAESYRTRKAIQEAQESEQHALRDFALQVWRDAEAQASDEPVVVNEGSVIDLVDHGRRRPLSGETEVEARSDSDSDTAVSHRSAVENDDLESVLGTEGLGSGNASASAQDRLSSFLWPDPRDGKKGSSKSPDETSRTSSIAHIRRPSVRFHETCVTELKAARRQAIIMSLPQDCYEGLKYQCAREDCGQVLPTLRSLTYHLHLHNMGSDAPRAAETLRHVCPDCRSNFQCRRDLLVHRCARVLELCEPAPTVSERPSPSGFTKFTSSMASCLRRAGPLKQS